MISSDSSIRPKITIITPVYNEEPVLEKLHQRVIEVMDATDHSWELILVNDGSRDNSVDLIAQLASKDSRVKGISLSRNFGFQIAVTAGLDHAQGDAIVIADADLQDPPEVIPEMIAKWQDGYDVVYGVRSERQGETWFKKVTAAAFYRLIDNITGIDIPLDTATFA